MIDLNRKPAPKTENTEPEGIAMILIAAALWIIIMIGWIGAL